jgi:uncharacterized membrane protein HdeD (DUF308 family)
MTHASDSLIETRRIRRLAVLGDWRWIVLRAVVAVLFGIATLVWPGITLTVLVLFWGAFVLVDGIAALMAAITGGAEQNRGWWALYGLAGIGAGIATFVWPAITALVLLVIIAAWAFVTGVLEIAVAIRFREEIGNEWTLGILGALSIAVAVLLLVAPVAGALAITWAIGWFAILFGSLLFTLALEARRAEKTAEATGRRRTSEEPTRTSVG